jgi:NitT/TauT family transport system substrate-binding protein
VVSVGGEEDAPAYLAVYAARTLGTFEAEGVRVTLRRAKNPAAAVNALRDSAAAVAVTTADQAVRGAWARGTPVRVVVAHTRAPATVLVVSAKHRGEVATVADLAGKRVGIPGPGTTAHLVLVTLLRTRKLEPWQVQLQSLGASALMTQLGTGALDAAMLDEPVAGRAVALGVAGVLLDLRRPDEAASHLGGPFYEVVSVVRADDKGADKDKKAAVGPPSASDKDKKAAVDLTPALQAYARALIRVQSWLAATPAERVAERLPALAREGAVARLEATRDASVADGFATEAGLRATLGVLRAGSPWPVDLKVTPETLGEPTFMTEVRKGLGPHPPAP